MPRVTVWVPDELHATIREDLPGLNWSGAMQRGLSAALDCHHEHVACDRCSQPIDLERVADRAVARFYAAAIAALEPLVYKIGTAEGACRILKTVAIEQGIAGADRFIIPRPSRSQRRRQLQAAV